MRKRVILHVVPKARPTVGGLQHYVHELATEQARAGHIVRVLSLGAGANRTIDYVRYRSLDLIEPILAKARASGIIEPSPQDLSVVREAIAHVSPDIIHAHEAPCGIVALDATEKLRAVTVITTLHNRVYLEEPAFRSLLDSDAWQRLQCTTFIAVSKAVATAHGLHGHPRTVVLPCAVNTQHFSRRGPKKAGASRYVLCPARIAFDQKRQVDAIRVVAHLVEQGLPVKLVLAGPLSRTRVQDPANDESTLAAILAEFSWVEWRVASYAQMPSLYSRAACSLAFSRAEGFGRVPVESILANTPCLVDAESATALPAYVLSVLPPVQVSHTEETAGRLADVLAREGHVELEALSKQLAIDFAIAPHAEAIQQIYDSAGGK
ncbi:MAG: glycosyltransferase family 4 protein [Gemmatimonadaceae bacterium]